MKYSLPLILFWVTPYFAIAAYLFTFVGSVELLYMFTLGWLALYHHADEYVKEKKKRTTQIAVLPLDPKPV